MKCPSCGAIGMTKAVKRCRSCGQAYLAEDLLELHQLQFLLEETAGWEGTEARREAYAVRLETLRERMVPPKAAEPAAAEPVAAPVAVAEAKAVAVPAAEPPVKRPVPAPAAPPAPPKEKVPFDQWLLSERNIKLALYAGAALLVVAMASWTSFLT